MDHYFESPDWEDNFEAELDAAGSAAVVSDGRKACLERTQDALDMVHTLPSTNDQKICEGYLWSRLDNRSDCFSPQTDNMENVYYHSNMAKNPALKACEAEMENPIKLSEIIEAAATDIDMNLNRGPD
jgi:hypothetical protein